MPTPATPVDHLPSLPLTKIVATVGPASATVAVLVRLIESGATVFRLNFGHGTLDEHAARVAAIREAAAGLGRPVAVLGDLQGPKIRVGPVPGDGLELTTGEAVVFVGEPVEAVPGSVGQPHRFGSTYKGLVRDVAAGHRLLVNDGAVRLLVIEVTEAGVACTVTHGGLVTSGKGINLPDSDLAVSALTDQDRRHVDWAVAHDLDFLALSFVRSAADVRTLADLIAQAASRQGRVGRIQIVAKVETPRGVERIEEISEASDAIMVARGDLGVEMDLAEVPVIQKKLVAVTQDYGKPCIVATQMLESMIQSPVPTRAEANDVAGAIFDQADAVMLSAETAVGKTPSLAVEYMRRIAERTEVYLAAEPARPSPPARLVASGYRTAALAHGVWTAAQDVGARCIVVWSQTGGGARYLSQNNFHVPIVAVTSDERAARQMQLLRGVVPQCMPIPPTLGGFVREMDVWLRETGLGDPGDVCIFVAGTPVGQPRVTNRLEIHVLGDGRED